VHPVSGETEKLRNPSSGPSEHCVSWAKSKLCKEVPPRIRPWFWRPLFRETLLRGKSFADPRAGKQRNWEIPRQDLQNIAWAGRNQSYAKKFRQGFVLGSGGLCSGRLYCVGKVSLIPVEQVGKGINRRQFIMELNLR